MADLVHEIEAQIAGAKSGGGQAVGGRDPRDWRRRGQGRGARRRHAERDARLRPRHHRPGAEPRRDRSRRDRARRLHAARGRRRGARDRQAAAGAGRQGPPRPRRQHARRAAGRQRPDSERRRVSGREAGARDHPAPSGRAAGADRHHADRRDDSDRPRPARADHRRSLDRQDDDLHRHDHQPGAPQQGGRGGRRHQLSTALLHLRGDRTEAIDDRADHRRAGRGRRDAVHHHPRLAGVGLGDQPVPRAVRRRGDGRVVHGQRHGRADRLRRSVQARRGLPAGVARVEAPVGPRGLPGRCVLPPQPAARARGAGRREVRQRLADRPADHRNAVGGRVRLHPDQRHLDHRRTDLPGDRPVLPGHPAGDLGRHLGVARRIGRAAQGDEAGRRAAQGRSRAVPGAGRLRPVRVGAGCGDAGQDRPRQARRRALQAAAVQPDPGRSAGRR